MAQNYTLGRGKVYLARKTAGVLGGFRYIGNTPELSLTIEDEELPHYNSDEGVREKDDSVSLEVNRSGTLVTDNIDPKNVALFFFGDASTVTQTSVASADEDLTSIEAGHAYKLGVSASNPAGYFGIDETGFEVVNGVDTLTADTDYIMDFDNGMIEFVEGSSLAADGDDITVTYAVAASTRSRVISGSQPVEGALRFVSKNPKGTNSLIYMPSIRIRPNGDYALKGDEWQQIPLSLEIIKPTGAEAIYRDGAPAYT